MNKRELFQWLHDVPDNTEIKVCVQGEVFDLGHAITVPEWNVIYFGESKDELIESLQEAQENEDDAIEEMDREAFLHSLEEEENYMESEDYDPGPSDDDEEPSVDCCEIPDRAVKESDTLTGVM